MARYDLGQVKGPKGDKGDQGATGPVGPQGIQGPPAKVCGKEPDTQGNIVLGAGDVGAANQADHNLRTYTTLAQLGLSGEVTMEQVCAALPPHSTFQARNGPDDTNKIVDAPARYTMITVDQSVSGYIFCEATDGTSCARYHAFYQSNVTPKFKGWMPVAASNRNLLDNWYFVDPINQQGKQSYTSGYTIDRWVIYSSPSVTLTEDGVHFVGPAGRNGGFQQPIEHPTQYNGKTMTFSALIKGRGVLIVNNPGSTGSANMVSAGFNSESYTLVSVTFVWNVTHPDGYVNALLWSDGSNPADFYVKAVKLELGPVQTLAHQENGAWVLNDPPPNLALELAKCQRYYFEANNLGLGYPHVAIAIAKSATVADCIIEVPVSMRVIPAVIYSGNWRLFDSSNSTVIAVSNIGLWVSAINTCTSKIGLEIISTGLTPGRVYWLSGNGLGGGIPKLALDANL